MFHDEQQQEEEKMKQHDHKGKKISLDRDDISNIFDSMLRSINITDHHTKSFDLCMSKWIPDIIKSNANLSTVYEGLKYKTLVRNYRFVRQTILPSQAYLFNISYTGDIYVDILQLLLCKTPTNLLSDDKEFPYVLSTRDTLNLKLCEFPIMVKSKICYLSDGYDSKHQLGTYHGGYFIIRGKRRYIPMLRTLANNYCYCFEGKRKNKQVYYVHLRSLHFDKIHRSTSTLEIWIDKKISQRTTIFDRAYVQIPFLKQTISITVLIVALGWTRENFWKLLIKIFSKDWNEVKFQKYYISFKNSHCNCFDDQMKALEYINKICGKHESSPETSRRILNTEVLPHLHGDDNSKYCSNDEKVVAVAMMYRKLLLFREGIIPAIGRDDLYFNRLVTSGALLAQLFRTNFLIFMMQALKVTRRYLTDKKNNTMILQGKKFLNVHKIYNFKRLTTNIISAISTGNWSQQRKGISHSMISMNDETTLSQLLKLMSTFVNNAGKHITPRMLLETYYGYICAADTPESESCGLVLSLACTARVVTQRTDDISFMKILTLSWGNLFHMWSKDSNENLIENLKYDQYYVFDTYSRIVGFIVDIESAVEIFHSLRRTLAIDPTITIMVDHQLKELHIFSDLGRIVRPLIVRKNLYKLSALLSIKKYSNSSLYKECLLHGIVEYVDPNMEKYVIPSHKIYEPDDSKSTHLELTSVSFVGICATMAPFFRCNQGPRLVYWISMSKQKICCAIPKDFGAPTVHSLRYGQKATVYTRTSQVYNEINTQADGINCVVGFAPHQYAQEDGFVVNRASIDRGLFISDSIRTYCLEKQGSENNNCHEEFIRPTRGSTFSMKLSSYDKIEADGLPRPGTKVNGGDVIIGKTVKIKKISSSAMVNVSHKLKHNSYQQSRRDQSLCVKHDEGGVVHDVYLAKRSDCHIAKVTVMTERIPEIGDKFSSRHSQKGTICYVSNPEDMLFVPRTGMTVDIITSPIIPTTRMTMGHFLEVLLGKAVCIEGDVMAGIDEQFFESSTEKQIEHIKSILLKNGYHYSGKELCIDGKTGQRIQVPLYTGIIYYTKLNHMVSRKAHARSTGPRRLLTRQPAEGRKLGGGLRFGLMEGDCAVGHGAAEHLREKLLTNSDGRNMWVCDNCGFHMEVNESINLFYCRNCKTGKYARQVVYAHTSNIMQSELNALGIKLQLKLKDI